MDDGKGKGMYKIWFLVWIWKRSIFGFWYKAPVIRTAHADRAAARRLGRLFTFEDLFGVAITTIGTASTTIPATIRTAATTIRTAAPTIR